MKITKTLKERSKIDSETEKSLKIAKTFKERVKTMSKLRQITQNPSNSLKNSKICMKIIGKIAKILKERSKTGSESEKHVKITKTLIECSKTCTFYEKCCTGPWQNSSKALISLKKHRNCSAKRAKTLKERVETMSKLRHNHPNPSNFVKKCENSHEFF